MQTVDKYKALASRLVRNPDDTDALISQFSVLSEGKGHAAQYLTLAARAYALKPDDVNVALNYGSALHRAGEFEKALTIYQKCAKLASPEWLPSALHHVGISYRSLNKNKLAIENYTKAIELSGRLDIMKDRALAMMADGQLREGLKAFEVRREMAANRLKENGGELIAQQKLPDGVVHWEGQDLKGKTVVVYHEEGQGDFIQFCRFIPKLRELGAAKVLLTGPVPNLLDIVADNIELDGVVPLSGPFECDYVVGSMSLPWRCGIDYDQVNGKPYFKAEASTIPLRGNLNIGLVWRGNPAYGMDAHRSVAFSEYCALFDLPGVAFYSLQAGAPSLEVTNLGFDGFVANLEPFMKNWRETAKLIQALDVVVTVDTACAHLAGALGKPVFILITAASDWRWNRNSQKSVWYDSARVIRQKKQDDWAPCIKIVRDQLKDMLGERRQAA